MEWPLSASDPTSDTTEIPPALEPPHARFDEHKRSFATLRVVFALVMREMTTQYGRSPGGYLWAILEPVGMIVALSWGFSLLMRTPSLGNSFIVFYASGYLVFTHYRLIEKAVHKSILYSRSLLYYPAVTWIDTVIARFVLNLLTSLLNSILIFGGILMFTDTTVVLDFPPIILAFTLATILGAGIGSLNCLLTGLYPIWKSAWKIVTRPLMLASAVIYIFEDMPEVVGNVLWWNPLVHLTGLMRTGVYATYRPQYISEIYVLAIGLVTLALGLMFLRAYNNDIVYND